MSPASLLPPVSAAQPAKHENVTLTIDDVTDLIVGSKFVPL